MDKSDIGTTVVDKITQFSGVVTGYCSYISGCNQALVTPPVGKDGTLVEPHWIDEQRLVQVGTVKIVLDNANGNGFDLPPPKR